MNERRWLIPCRRTVTCGRAAMSGSLRTAGRPDLGTSLSLGLRREQGRPRWVEGEHSQTPATPGVAAVAPTSTEPASREPSRPAPPPPAPPRPLLPRHRPLLPRRPAPRLPPRPSARPTHLRSSLSSAVRRLRAPGPRSLLRRPRMPSPSAPSPGPCPPRPRPKSPGRSPHSALSPSPPHLSQGSHQRGKVRAVRSVAGRDPALGRPGPCSFPGFAPEALRPGREGPCKKLGAVLKGCFLRRTRVLLCPALGFSREQNSSTSCPGWVSLPRGAHFKRFSAKKKKKSSVVNLNSILMLMQKSL